jgi:hypothetical protein
MPSSDKGNRPDPVEALEELGRLALREHTMKSLCSR